MKKRLITAALPYVNNIPHLGNLIQVLSADVFARYCRSAGYETLYVCGTDEYGTATETRALKEGVTPQVLCDRYHLQHSTIYNWFHIQFDFFGRTSTPVHNKMVQDIFLELDQAGFVTERDEQQLFCEQCSRFLADRFVLGQCPHCAHTAARGDQCENCGKMLEPTDLLNPQCEVCHSEPIIKATKNLYINLPALVPQLEAWMQRTDAKARWATNAYAMTRGWIKEGLLERCITRDLKWGIPVPKVGFEDKVFYVWFDAPIGYVSLTAEYLPQTWQEWWQNPQNVELIQFIGKDNVPFHTLVFPATQLGSKMPWTMLHRMSSTEYLNYETGKFSKTHGVGVFGNDCISTGIDVDMWRFYLIYMRPEKHDTLFSWKIFKEVINSELIGNLGNFVNRTLAFCDKFYDGKVPQGQRDEVLWAEIQTREQSVIDHLEKSELRDGLKALLSLTDLGNKTFQASEPWRTRNSNPAAAANTIFNLAYLVLDVARLMLPFMPNTAHKLSLMLNGDLNWIHLGQTEGLDKLNDVKILFSQLEEAKIEQLRLQFGGNQEERKMTEVPSLESVPKSFSEIVDLRVAHVFKVVKHSEADKLYILQVRIGEEERQIVSSIVPYYTPEQLLGRNVVIVANLKKTKFRGEESRGMLIAAEAPDDSCEVIFVDAPHGTRVLPDGMVDVPAKTNIKTDDFHAFELKTIGGIIYCGDLKLQCADGMPLKTTVYLDAPIG